MVFTVAGSALHTLVRSAEPAQHQARHQGKLSFKDLTGSMHRSTLPVAFSMSWMFSLRSEEHTLLHTDDPSN
jgi:hypothetical protein